MIDLNAPTRTVLGVDLAADTDDPRLLHALPAPPQVAIAGGGPDLQLLRFVDDGALTGGHLRLSVDLRHPDGRLDEVAAELNRDPATAARPFRVSPAAVTAVTARLEFLGQEPNGQGGLTPLVARPYADAPGRIPYPHTASFSVELTPAGVQILDAALRSAGAPIVVVVQVQVEGRWPAHRVVARIDWGRVYDHLSVHLKRGWLFGVDDIAQVVEGLRQDQSIQISVVQSLTPEHGGGPADADAAVAWIQRELVERFCEPVLPLSREPAHASLGTVGEIFGVGTAFAAKALTQIERAVATVDFQQAIVLTRTYTLQTHLADLLAGDDAAAHISDAGLDHPFFQRFGVRIRTSAPPADLFLTEVAGELGYGTSHLPVRLTPDDPEVTVEAWADASPDRTWTFTATAAFADTSPVRPGTRQSLPQLTGRTRELPLDLAQLLSLVRFTVEQPPDPRVLFSTAVVRQYRGDTVIAQQDLTLTPEQPAVPVWFSDRRPEDRFSVAAQHLLADGRRLSAAPVPIDSATVVLPPAIPDGLSVQLIAADDWATDGVQRIVVALQRVGAEPGDATGPSAEPTPDGAPPATPPTEPVIDPAAADDSRSIAVVLDHPGAIATVSLDLPDPFDRRYRYRTTRLLVAGEQRDPWQVSDRSVLLVGTAGGELLVVDVCPVGPELATAGITLIEVDLSYVDAVNQVRDQQTLVIRARSERPRWQVRLADPNRRSYEYRTTVHRTTGAVTVGNWTDATDRLLAVPVV